jgi:hypothetical protein
MNKENEKWTKEMQKEKHIWNNSKNKKAYKTIIKRWKKRKKLNLPDNEKNLYYKNKKGNLKKKNSWQKNRDKILSSGENF